MRPGPPVRRTTLIVFSPVPIFYLSKCPSLTSLMSRACARGWACPYMLCVVCCVGCCVVCCFSPLTVGPPRKGARGCRFLHPPPQGAGPAGVEGESRHTPAAPEGHWPEFPGESCSAAGSPSGSANPSATSSVNTYRGSSNPTSELCPDLHALLETSPAPLLA